MFLHSTSGSPVNLYYSTSPTISSLNEGSLRVPIVQSAELDDNLDGRVERIELGIKMPLAPGEQITGFSAVFYHEVKLSKKARYMFDGLSYVNYESSTAMGNLYVDGDIMVRQTFSLSSKGG